MHRQSLSSPPPIHHLHHTSNSNTIVNDIATTTTILTSSPNPSTFDQEVKKPQKKLHGMILAERFIHFIPMLIVLCFLILYLSSHHPSQKELAQFNGLKRLHKPIDNSFDGMEKRIEEKKEYVLVNRSLRFLQELEKEEIWFEDRQKHRKIGDF